jgi:heptosyltransferase-2
MYAPKKILVIQTAFTGDVILASALLESLHEKFPESKIDFVLRKGNEALFQGHPFLNRIYIWNKKKNKIRNLFSLIAEVRKEKYDLVFNLQRFFSSGLIAFLSRAKAKSGFDKNPFSFVYSRKVKHEIGNGSHEISRNHKLVEAFAAPLLKPKLYPSENDFRKVEAYKSTPYICIAPASVWFTKQFPIAQWIRFVDLVPVNYTIYILGSSGDSKLAEEIVAGVKRRGVADLCGRLSFLESAALMKDARMNYVNDSAPLHIASAMNAPVSAIFCSTIPEFGFGPLSDKSRIIQVKEKLSCRPCGLHGKKKCPEGDFRCGNEIDLQELIYDLRF